MNTVKGKARVMDTAGNRQSLEAEIKLHQKSLDNASARLAQLILDEKATENMREHVTAIAQLLETATVCLIQAGEIGADHGIEFTFTTPKGQTESFNPNWVNSACYASDGWFYDREDN
jgi:hypothetical protein